MNIFSKIVLGTVQFGTPYGIKKNKSLISKKEVFRILDLSWKFGVRSFDLSTSYGFATSRIFDWLQKNKLLNESNIIFKFKAEDDLSKVLYLDDFSQCKSLTLMSHGYVPEKFFFKKLEFIKNYEFITGQSIYEIEEYNNLKKGKISRFQIPGNIFNFHLINKIKKEKKFFDIRSIFLQGLILNPEKIFDRKLQKLKFLIKYLEKNINLIDFSFNFVLHRLKKEDRIVIGVDSINDLKDINNINVIEHSIINKLHSNLVNLDHFKMLSKYSYDPRRWL